MAAFCFDDSTDTYCKLCCLARDGGGIGCCQLLRVIIRLIVSLSVPLLQYGWTMLWLDGKTGADISIETIFIDIEETFTAVSTRLCTFFWADTSGSTASS